MKTVKTSSGLRIIDSDQYTVMSNQLRSILQEDRKAIINNLIDSGLNRYIDYKFGRIVDTAQLNRIILKLQELGERHINMIRYGQVMESLEKYDFIQVGNGLFFMEIDHLILQCLSQVELFHSPSRGIYQL
jgi:DNA topoisomerase VI subunit B